MKRKRYTEEQIVYALRQTEAGVAVSEICRTMGVSELRELGQLRDENRRLKKLVADLSLDKHILQEVLSKKV
jgi:putative transposase